jgi:hypothetical protein
VSRCWPILLLALPLGCAAPDPQDRACNDWLDGRRAELALRPGTPAFDACTTVARSAQNSFVLPCFITAASYTMPRGTIQARNKAHHIWGDHHEPCRLDHRL